MYVGTEKPSNIGYSTIHSFRLLLGFLELRVLDKRRYCMLTFILFIDKMSDSCARISLWWGCKEHTLSNFSLSSSFNFKKISLTSRLFFFKETAIDWMSMPPAPIYMLELFPYGDGIWRWGLW